MRSLARSTVASLSIAVLSIGCSLANAPDDVKAGPGEGAGGGSGGAGTTSAGGGTSTTTTTTTTTTTSTGAGGATCDDGTADCDGDAANGCEAKLDTIEHCGACDVACVGADMHVATPSCNANACDYDACAPGFGDCDQDRANGCEADLSADVAHCGTCDAACAPANADGATCVAGLCGYGSCLAGFGDCDGDPANGCETQTEGDLANCGGCGLVCNPSNAQGPMCSAGQCGFGACQPGFSDCDNQPATGCETNVMSDPKNCGGCGILCGGGSVCFKGGCTLGNPLFDSFTGAGFKSTRGAGDSCGTKINVSGNVNISHIAVKNDLDAGGHLRFLIFDSVTKALLFVSPAKTFADDGDSWKTSDAMGFALKAGKSYDIGAIADVGGGWDGDTVAENVPPIASTLQNPNFSNFASPTLGSPGLADCAIRLYP